MAVESATARPSRLEEGTLPMAEQRHTGNPGDFPENSEKAERAGEAGGQHRQGNFAGDRERAAEAGRKGGENSHGGGGADNNRGNFAQDRDRGSEAGRKGAGRGAKKAPETAPDPLGNRLK